MRLFVYTYEQTLGAQAIEPGGLQYGVPSSALGCPAKHWRRFHRCFAAAAFAQNRVALRILAIPNVAALALSIHSVTVLRLPKLKLSRICSDFQYCSAGNCDVREELARETSRILRLRPHYAAWVTRRVFDC